MQRRKDETLFAVAPSVLARVLCRYCTDVASVTADGSTLFTAQV